MITIEKVYLFILLIITLWFIYIYLTNDTDYKNELARITKIEKENEQKKLEIENERSKTTACYVEGLDGPRKCYFDSNFTCKWNTKAERCDQIN